MRETFLCADGKTPKEIYGNLTWTQTQVTAGATSTLLLAANTLRKAVILQNISDEAIDVSLDGTAATTSDGFRVYSDGDTLVLTAENGLLTSLALYGIDSSGVGSRSMRVLEGV